MCVTQFQTVLASKVNDATNKKNEAQEALDSANQQKKQLEKERSSLQSELDQLDSELGEVLVELAAVESDIAAANDQLDQIQADLTQAEEDEAAQYDSMKKRIRFLYEQGDSVYLTSFLESKSMADLLNRVEYVNELYEYDRKMLTEYQETKQQVAELKEEVETQLAELQELENTYQEQQQQYETMIAQKQTEISDFDTKLADIKQIASKMQSTIDQQNEIIRQEEERRQAEEAAKRASSSSGSESGDSSSGSATGQAVVDYACQYIGNKYVYGGNDINNGIDCSGFTKYVYAHFGVTLPRYSGAQRSCGVAVSYSEAQPGDLFFYSGHVAIYMGNGQIVHASNSKPYPAGGIKVSSATYRTILAIRRVL